MVRIALPRNYGDTTDDRSWLHAQLVAAGRPGLQLDHLETDPATGLVAIMTETEPDLRPLTTTLHLSGTFRGSMVADLAARCESATGQTLVEVDVPRRIAVSAALPPLDVTVRDAIAAALGTDPRNVELRVTWADDGHCESVVLHRVPLSATPETRARALASLCATVVPDHGPGWQWDDGGAGSPVTLTWGRPPELPQRVALGDLMPATFSPDFDERLPLGCGVDGEPAFLDFSSAAHTLVVGPPGSGKSVALSTLSTLAVTHGWRIGVIDPIKGGLDFKKIKPGATVWATELADAQTAMQQIYTESQRRKRLLDELDLVKVADMTPDQKREFGCEPWLVLIDELSSLFLMEPVPKFLDKDSPEVQESQQHNMAKEIIISLAGKIAREARFVSMHLLIATQRAGADVMPTELRANLAARVQLVTPGSPPDRSTLGMAMIAEQLESAYAIMTDLDDGHSKGLALLGAEGGKVQGVRVGFADASTIPDLLRERRVPTLPADQQWDLTPAALAPANDAAPRRRRSSSGVPDIFG